MNWCRIQLPIGNTCLDDFGWLKIIICEVAQLVEHMYVEHSVMGSSPIFAVEQYLGN